MGNSGHRAERGATSAGHHVHVENGRGRGALTSVLVVPEQPVGALASALETLYDPRGPADLDERLGRLAAQAPSGTAFLVGLGDQAWVYPSAIFVVRRRGDPRADLLTEPQVVALRAADRVELVDAASGQTIGALAGRDAPEQAQPEPAREPPAAGTLLVPVDDPDDAEPPDLEVDQTVSETERRPAPSRARVAVPTAILGVLGLALALGIWKGGGVAGGPRRDAHLAPAARAAGPTGSTTLREDERTAEPPPPASPKKSWVFRASAAISSSPLVVGDRVIFGSRDSTLYCVDAGSGEPLWKTRAGAGIGSSPVEKGGLCFVGTYAGRLLATDVDSGELRWRAATGDRIVSSPCVVGDRVVVGSYDRSVHAFDRKSGDRRWSFATGAAVRASPEPVRDDAVVVGSSDGSLYCLEANDGKLCWRLRVGSPVLAAAAFDPAADLLVAGAQDGTILGIDVASGAVRWRRTLQGEVNAQPRFAGSVVLVGTGRGRLHALDPASGSSRWLASAARGFDARPAVVEDLVVAPSFDGVVHFLALGDGSSRGQRALGAEVFASPAVGTDLLYVGTLGGAMHALPLP
jgi:outer membrane protein assembly factor BamB